MESPINSFILDNFSPRLDRGVAQSGSTYELTYHFRAKVSDVGPEGMRLIIVT